MAPAAKRVIPIVPASNTAVGKGDGSPELISLYEKHRKIHPRSVSGRFASWRWVMVWVALQAAVWKTWASRQSE